MIVMILSAVYHMHSLVLTVSNDAHPFSRLRVILLLLFVTILVTFICVH